MTLIEWEAINLVGSVPAYKNKRYMLDDGRIPLHSRFQLFNELTDYKVSSVSKGKVWLKRNNHD